MHNVEPRHHIRNNFVGGSVVLSKSASTADITACSGTKNPALVSMRDPILTGDIVENRPIKKLPPEGANFLLQTSATDEGRDRICRKARKPAYDCTRAGIRTDVEKEFRASLRRIPLPSSWYEPEPEEKPREHMYSQHYRPRDVILQYEDEFKGSNGNRGIRTFPRHLRRSRPATADTYRPNRRILGDHHPESASRVLHYNLPPPEEPQKSNISDKNAGSGESVIKYRFSGGICPSERKLVDTRPNRHVYEYELKRHLRQFEDTKRLYTHNQRRANHDTCIY